MFGGENPKPNPFGSTTSATAFGSGSSVAPNVDPFGSASSQPLASPFGNPNQQPGAQTFGGSGSAPVFGQTAPGTFGANPTFGAGSQGFGSSSSGTFGAATTGSSLNTFGSNPIQSSGFGTSATQPSSVFGSTKSVNNVFGSSTMEATTGSGFGSLSGQTPNVFGAVSSQTAGVFGAPKAPATTSTFGGSQSGPVFGAPHTQTNTFGAGSKPTSVFGPVPASTVAGTFGTPFTQATSVFGAGSTQTTASVFGTGTAQTTASVFGTGTAQTTASVFGTGTAQTTASVFGTGTAQTTASVFGTGTAQTTANVFGTGTAKITAGVFGTGTAQTTAGVFGTGTTQASGVFGRVNAPTTTNTFAAGNAPQTSGVFGIAKTESSNIFGAPKGSSSASSFGKTSTTTFGTMSSGEARGVFGVPSSKPSGVIETTQTQPSSVFGAASSTGSSMLGAGGAQTTAGVFGGAAAQNTVFGGPQVTFGAPGFGASTKPSLFGAAVLGATNTTSASSSMFGVHNTMTSGSGNTEARTSSSASSSRAPATFSNAASVLAGSSKFSQQTASNNSQPPQSSVFGLAKQDQTSINVFGKADQKKPDESKTIFGKPAFGKPSQDSAPSQFSGTFSQEVSEKPSIFGGASTFGGTYSDGSSGSQKTGESSSKQPVKMLFGKVVIEETRSKAAGKREEEMSAEDPEVDQGEVEASVKVGPYQSKSRSSSPPRSRSDREVKGGREKVPSISSRSRLSRQFSSPKDTSDATAIVCSRVPTKYFTKDILRTHFSAISMPTRIYVNNVKGTAIVHFADHESAKRAKLEGRYIDEAFPAMVINWSTYRSKSSTPESVRERDQNISSQPTTSPTAPGPSRSWAKRSMFGTTVEDELASMGGKSTLSRQKISFSDPPKEKEKSSDGHGGELKKTKVTRVKGKKSRSQSPLPLRKDLVTLERPISPKFSISTRERSASPLPSMSQSVSSQSTVEVSSSPATIVPMSSLKQVVARTTNEMFEALESRDKLIKSILQTRKQRDLASARVSIGTCPDMCPEKERYMREERRRLTIYEADLGSISSSGNPMVDHRRAVKEYTRSSADQDMALPHELRPSHVLDLTMNYLVNNVLDLGGEGKWEEWYEFLWNRTRGIRKDITQQQLCDMTTVSLVEKCCRFHIYCSERLCEEEMPVFDAKINNENLTKCLQTLKELYHDMRERHGVQCENEAEFRAYMVLMNLNQGDILWEIQQLEERIRRHPDLAFVLKVHSVLNTNNYVLFFRLVHHASFLQACLMHRYFDQVRRHAIRAMARCYSARGLMPAEKLMRILGFEAEQQVMNFCSFHGLEINDQAQVVFKDFVNPDANYAGHRAQLLIESKQGNLSVGQIVNGGPLPPNVLHEPVSSFDANGYFKPEALSVMVNEPELREPVAPEATSQPSVSQESVVQDSAVEASDTVEDEASASEAVVPNLPRPQAVYVSNDIVKEVAKTLFLEVIHETATQVASTMLSRLNLFVNLVNTLIQTMAEEVVEEECSSIAEEVIGQLQMAELERQARQRAEESAARGRATMAVVDDLSHEVADDQCRVIANQEYENVQATLRRQTMNLCARDVAQDLCSSTVEAEINGLIQDFYMKEVVRRRVELDAFSKAVEMMRVGRYFRVWRNMLAGRQRLKRDILTFPSAPSMSSAVNIVKRLIPDSKGATDHDIHLGKMARLTLLPPSEAYRNREAMNVSLLACRYLQQLRDLSVWSPLDLVATVGPGILKNRKEQLKKGGRVHWKLLLSLPSLDESSALSRNDLDDLERMLRWMAAKLAHGAVPPGMEAVQTSVWSLYTSHLDAQRMTSLHVCVRAVHGCISQDAVAEAEREHLFTGSSAVLFVLSQPYLDRVNLGSWWKLEKLRLENLLRVLPRRPAVPLCVVCCQQTDNDDTIREIVTQLELNRRVAKGVISDYHVLVLRDVDDMSSTTVLMNAVSWLSIMVPAPPRLATEYTLDYMDNFLGREFYAPVCNNLAERRKKGLLDLTPLALVSLYRTLVCHLADTVRDPDLQDLSWPPSECTIADKYLPTSGWNSPSQLGRVHELVMSANLPPLDRAPPHDWLPACEMLWDYTESLQRRSGRIDNKMNSQIRWLLRRAKANFDEFGGLFVRDFSDLPPSNVIPWTDIVLAWIDHQMDTLREELADIEEETEEQVYVHYDPEKLKRVPRDAMWKKTSKTDDPENTMLVDSVGRSVKRKHVSTSHKEITKAMRLHEDSSSAPLLDLEVPNPEKLQAEAIAQDLHNAVATERSQMARFNDMLRRAVEEGNLALGKPTVAPLLRLPEGKKAGHGHLVGETPVSFRSRPHLDITPIQRDLVTRRDHFPGGLVTSTPYCSLPGALQKPAEPQLSKPVTHSLDCTVDPLRKTERRQLGSLEDRIAGLQQMLASERKAAKLHEMRLQQASVLRPL